MEEKMEMQLADESLDDIVGGAFNQQAVSKHGLNVLTGDNGAQGLIVQLTYQERKGSSYSGTSSNTVMSERTLKNYVNKPGELSVKVQTTTGEMKKLSRNDLKELFS
jgi:hypothetical protein